MTKKAAATPRDHAGLVERLPRYSIAGRYGGAYECHRSDTGEWVRFSDVEQAAALAAPPAERPATKRTGCINCGEANDGGYETEAVGPFCSQCWGLLEDALAARDGDSMESAPRKDGMPKSKHSVSERLSGYLGLRPDQIREILRHRCGCESEDDHQTGNPDCAVGLLIEAVLERSAMSNRKIPPTTEPPQ